MKFIEMVKSGKCSIDEIDDYIDKWHDEYQGNLKLHEYLGMTDEEYNQWLINPNSLKTMYDSNHVAKQLIKLAKQILSFKGGYYRGINKKVDIPFSNKVPFTMWITPDKEYVQENFTGTLFEIDIDQNKLNAATPEDILNLDEEGEFGEYEDIIEMMMNYYNDDQLLNFLKKHGYNGIQFDDYGNNLICIMDKSLIKNYRIIN